MTDLRCYLHAPSVVFAARVNMASATYPLDEIVYDTVTTGAYTDILPGMTVLLGSSAGADDYGRQRVRAACTSTKVYVGRSSQGTRDGELTVTDNAYITVLNLFQVWAKIPFIDTADNNKIYKDSEIAAAGNVADPPPIANGGVGFAGTIDSGTNVVTVEFTATDSVQFDAALSSALSQPSDFLWDVEDGTITVGTITSMEITATFPAGFRYVHLTVTSDAGKTHTHHIPVFARDPDDDDTIAFQIVSHRKTPQGQELGIKVLDDVPRATYPDGTLVMVWNDDADLVVSDPFRVHMIFCGWHQNDDAGAQAERTATLRDTVLNCVDTAGRLKTLPGFPQLVEAAASPATWSQTRYPNVFYYLWYLLYWHSTALEVSDLLLGTQILNNFAFKILGSDAADLYTQVNSLANNVTPDHHLTCNRFNQLKLVVDPLIQSVASRSSSIEDSLTDADWSHISFTYRRSPRTYKLLSYAIDSDDATVTAIAAMAPGLAEGQGATYIETSERIAASQFDLNTTEGNRYARLNAPYGLFTIVVPFERLNANVDPANLSWVRLTVASGNAPQRELPITNQRGIVQEMNIAYDYQPTGLARTATLMWEMETSGPAAVTYTPPVAEG